MKKTTAAALCTVLLTGGCLDAPDDTAGMRSLSNSHPFLTTRSFHANRSVSAVNASLAAGAEKCFQRVSSHTVYGGSTGYGGRPSAPVVLKYTYSMRRTPTSGELALHRRQVNANILTPDKDGGYVYLVDARAASGGTEITLHTGKFGYKELDAAMYNWATGKNLYCPAI